MFLLYNDDDDNNNDNNNNNNNNNIILPFPVINSNQNTVDLFMKGLTMGVTGTGSVDCPVLPNYVHM